MPADVSRQSLRADESPPAFGKKPGAAARAGEEGRKAVWAVNGLRDAGLADLVRLLGDADFATRQAAEEEIQRRGFAAYDALSAAANDSDLEVASRARYLLHSLRSNVAAESDAPKVRELLADYAQTPIDQRPALLRRVAELPDLAGTAALCRLLRVERSPELIDTVVSSFLLCEPFPPLQRARQAELFRVHLTGVERPAAHWLLDYAAVRGGATDLEKLVHRTEELEKNQGRAGDALNPCPAAVLLWYSVAHQHSARGQAAQADEFARRARRLPPSTDPQACAERLSTAMFLMRRGDFHWAELELRLVGASGQREAAGQAMYLLGEMYHDQERDLEAATLLSGALDRHGAVQLGEGEDGDPVVNPRARMYYFYACHYARAGNAAKQRDYLEKAILADPSEVDALIACHRLAPASSAFRRRTALLIQRAATGLRRRIEAAPETPAAYNQLAWLLGNTHGDLEEAARCARRALELTPNSGTFLDTLAHVHFAKGDYEQAVKYQTMAAEQEPNVGPIRRQLAAFRQAWQSHGGAAGAAANPAEKAAGARP